MRNIDCEFCGCRATVPVRMSIDGKTVTICSSCEQSYSANECFDCHDVSDPLIGGRCIACATIEAAKIEKRRHEIANGLGVDALEMLTRDIIFTEKDYEHWVTFGQGNFKQSKSAQVRLIWLRSKVVGDSGWTADQFDENIASLMSLLERNEGAFTSPCRFMLYNEKARGKGIRGTIIDRESKVYLMEV